MKKIISLLIAVIFMLTLCACGGKEPENKAPEIVKQDISGVYEEFENITTFETDTHTITNKKIKDGGILQLISKDGCSYSFYAPNHYWGDSNADFLAFLNL